MKKIILSVLLLLTPVAGFSAESLPWETTFDCAEWSDGSSLSCDELQELGSCGSCSVGGEVSQITTSANYSSGGGGRGFRYWVGDGDDINTQPIGVEFSPTNYTEVWIRWYMRYENGFAWDGLNYDKWWYIDQGESDCVIPEWSSTNSTIYPCGGAGQYNSSDGWAVIMGGATSDGAFHLYEIHIKMDKNGSNGIARLWIDGDLKIDQTAADFGTSSGWHKFYFKSNQLDPNNGGPAYIDFDDIKMVTSDPGDNCPSDGQSYSCIGAYGGDVTPPTISGNPTIGSNGTTVTINFSESVVTTGYDNGDFDLDCTTAGNNISLNSISGSGSSRTLTAASTIYPGDTCDLDYTGGADEIEDTSGNDLAQFSDDVVTNNSAASASESTFSGLSISWLF